MRIEYAHIIHDIVDKGIDVKHLAYLLERCNTKQVHELVEQLKYQDQERDRVKNTCKDSVIKEAALWSIHDEICRIQKQIEEL